MDTRHTYERLYAHALANYNNGGWDYFVECCGYEDFCRDAKEKGWQTYEAAFQFYKTVYHVLDDVRRDIRAA